MKYDIDLIIQRLKEFKDIFPSNSVTFDWLINEISTNGYSEELDREFKTFMYKYIFSKIMPSRNDIILQQISNLEYKVRIFISNQKKIIYDKNRKEYKFFPYPEGYYDKEIDQRLEEVFNQIIDSLFTTNYRIDEIIKAKEKIYDECNNRLKNTIKKSKFADYCGTEEYMLKKMEYILKCMDNIMNSDKLTQEYKNLFSSGIQKAKMINLCTLDKLDEKDDYKERYSMVEFAYLEILKIEDDLKKYIEPIWKEYLTNPSEYVAGQPYHFLMHVVTNGHVPENQITKVCTTLATDVCSPLMTGYSKFGYIVDFDIEQIDSISSEDSGSWVTTKDEFIDREFPSRWQLHKKIGDNKYVFYELETTSLLLLPWTVEEEMTRNNLKYHGAATGPDASLYSEIFVRRNNNPVKVIGYFAMSESGLEEINRINEQLDEKKPVIDLSYLYENKKSNNIAI